MNAYPEQYLHVTECQSGAEWIVPIRGNGTLDLARQVKRWIRSQFGGELRLAGKIMPRIDGNYYGKIITDGRPPDTCVCWQSGGFYVE